MTTLSNTETTTVHDTDEGLLDRVRALAPLLREEAALNEELRRIPDRSLAALEEAGVYRMVTPKHYGGYESSYRTVLDVLAGISAACPGIGWASALSVGGTWVVARCNDEFQDEVFAENPNARIPSVFGTFGARAKRVNGGIQVVGGGRWRFNSGCSTGDWDLLATIVDEPDGSESRVWIAVPMSDLEVLDDWDVMGARGTGSMGVACGDIRVPDRRVLTRGFDFAAASGDEVESEREFDNPYYNVPAFLVANLMICALPIGTAKGALETFLERLPGRAIAYTDYTEASRAPLTHLQVGEATLKIAAIEGLMDRHVNAAMEWKMGDPGPTPTEMLELQANISYAFKLAREAIDLLFLGTGSSVIRDANPIQRYQRDIQAFSQHPVLHADTLFENLGRVRCGMKPFGAAAKLALG